jgi:hypothetical protein
MNYVACVCLVVLGWSLPAYAQGDESSSWAVVGTFVPQWEVTSTFEPVAALHFSDDDISIADQNLKGTEFRIGMARGRALGGDWGVSFVRRSFDDFDSRIPEAGDCSGSGGATLVMQCADLDTDVARRDAMLNGIEAHKFVPFVTIARRVQIGMNFGGGIGFMSGQVDTTTSQTRYTCTFPPGVFPTSFDPGVPRSVCTGATISNVVTTQSGSSSGDIGLLLASESTMLPIGRAEVAVAVVVVPQFKIRIAGGVNYPGTNSVSITGVAFFGAN